MAQYKAPRWYYRIVGTCFGQEQDETTGEGVICDRFFKLSAIAKAEDFVQQHAMIGVLAQATVFDSDGKSIYTAL